MSNLLSLNTPGSLVEFGQQNTLTYILICSDNKTASQKLNRLLQINKATLTEGEFEDNIVRIRAGCCGLLGAAGDQLAQMLAIRDLLGVVQCHGLGVTHSLLTVVHAGFFYYHLERKSICYFQFQQKQQTLYSNAKSTSKLDACNIDIFAIIVYLLYNSKSIKQYITNWKNVFNNKQAFKLQSIKKNKNISKIDQFISSILNKQIINFKMARYSLQIIMQKLSWINNKQISQYTQLNQDYKMKCQNYNDLQFNKLKFVDNKKRLKHSNSMTNLSSTSKGRKYKKIGQPGKNSNIFKQNSATKLKQSDSFWNTNSNSKIFRNTRKSDNQVTNILSQTKNYQKQKDQKRKQIFMQSFYKINQSMITSSTANQDDLLKLLQKKQKNKYIINKQHANPNCNKQNQNKQNKIKQALQIKIVKPKIQLKLVSQNIQFSYYFQHKKKNNKLNSCIYSISQKMQKPHKIQEQIGIGNQNYRVRKQIKQIVNQKTLNVQKQKQNRSEVQTNKNQNQRQKKKLEQFNQSKQNIFKRPGEPSQILNQSKFIINQKSLVSKQAKNIDQQVSNQVRQVSPYRKNINFLIQSIKLFGMETILRTCMMTSLYTMYLYYYINCYKTGHKLDSYEQTHLNNMNKVATQVKKQLVKEQYTKNLTNSDIKQIQQILAMDKSKQQYTKEQVQQLSQKCRQILKTQFNKYKIELPKRKIQYIKLNNNSYKLVILSTMRVAITITIIDCLEQHNHALEDFARYQDIINGKSDLQIDLISQLRNFQNLFL